MAVAVILGALSVGAVWAKPTSQTPPPADFSGPVEFTGKVQSLPAPGTLPATPTPANTTVGIWKIQGLSVDVTADTKIEGAPQVGAIVRVKGTVSIDGVVHADSIAAIKGNTQLTGFVQVMPQGGNVGTWTIQGLKVNVTQDTKIAGSPAVGSFVHVNGTVDDAGNITAKEINVRNPGKGLGQEKDKEDKDEKGNGQKVSQSNGQSQSNNGNGLALGKEKSKGGEKHGKEDD